MCEVLAPAGDEASFYAAVNMGADAVYLGLREFSARRSAANFTAEELKPHVRTAHALGVKVYVALNTLVKEGELRSFFKAALSAWNAGADALILQDLFLGAVLKKTYPQMVLHLSTQAGVCNVYGARLAKNAGFSRVILARETPIEDIREIAAEIETEVFVQGALCTCFSGQCYFSSFVGGNSGNRGLCKQPCRKKYSIDRKGFDAYSYKISLSDLCAAEDLKAYRDAGVVSFKIEGRMRSAAYVGAASRYYKHLLGGENAALKNDFSALTRAYNRGGFTRGYAFGQDGNLISSDVQGHKGEKIGTVASLSKNDKTAFVKSAYRPRIGDGFKVIRSGKKEICGGAYRENAFERKGGFWLPLTGEPAVGDEVYLTSSVALQEEISVQKRCAEISVECDFKLNLPPKVRVFGSFGVREYTAEFCTLKAKNRAFTREEFIDCFMKTDAYPFRVSFRNLQIEDSLFIVKSALNAFRRSVYQCAFDLLSADRELVIEREPIVEDLLKFESIPAYTAVIDSDFSDKVYCDHKIDFAIFRPHDYENENEFRAFHKISEYYAWHKYLYLPAYCTGADLRAAEKRLEGFDGIYAEGAFAVEWCKERGLKLFAGTGFNLFNSISVSQAKKIGVQFTALSKELSLSEMKDFRCGSFVLFGGTVKLMELGHCPFAKTCADCDRRTEYTLCDESGRCFPLLRYKSSVCRFEIYNNVPLFVASDSGAKLYDFTAASSEVKQAVLSGKGLQERTTGALRRGIF